MNAVLTGVYDFDESEPMPVTEKDDLPIQVAELRSDVRHIQSDVSDIKTDLRATNQRIDTLEQKMERKFELAKQDLDKRFDEAKKDNDKQFEKVDARFEKVEERLDRLDLGIVAIKETLASWKVWAIGLYAGLAGSMLFVMAKGFKWF